MISQTRAIELTIHFWAERKHMSLRDVAKHAGIRNTTFAERMKGKRSWTLDEIDHIAQVFGLGNAMVLLRCAEEERARSSDYDDPTGHHAIPVNAKEKAGA